MGSLRAGLRRMAEAWVLRRAILDELEAGNPVMVLGDFNDGENAVSTEIITGETPFRNYAWLRRHDAKHGSNRYKDHEDAVIQENISAVQLHSAEELFVKKSQRDTIYTSAFGGVLKSEKEFLKDIDRENVGDLTKERNIMTMMDRLLEHKIDLDDNGAQAG